MDNDTSLITLEKIDLEFEWIIEAIDPIFDDEDLEWVDEVDREAKGMDLVVEGYS